MEAAVKFVISPERTQISPAVRTRMSLAYTRIKGSTMAALKICVKLRWEKGYSCLDSRI